MDTKQLQCFVISADYGNMRVAAEKLFMTRSSVSKKIKELELEIGCALLLRTPSGVELTREGREVYEQAVQMLISEEKIKRVPIEEDTFWLRVSTSYSHTMATICAGFLQLDKSSKYRLLYREGSVEQVIHDVYMHKTDIGFVLVAQRQFNMFLQSLKKSRIQFTELQTLHYVLSNSKNLRWSKASSIADMLKRAKLVSYEEDYFSLTNYIQPIDSDIEKAYKDRTKVLTNSSNLTRCLLENYDYSAITANFCDDEVNRQGYVERHRMLSDSDQLVFGYIFRSDSPLEPAYQQLLDFMLNSIK